MYYLVSLEHDSWAEVLDTADDSIERVSWTELLGYVSSGVDIKGVSESEFCVRYPKPKERILTGSLNLLLNEVSISRDSRRYSGYVYFSHAEDVKSLIKFVNAGHLSLREIHGVCNEDDILSKYRTKNYYLVPVVVTCLSLSYFVVSNIPVVWFESLRFLDSDTGESFIFSVSDSRSIEDSKISFNRKFGNYRFWDLYKTVCRDGYAKIYI